MTEEICGRGRVSVEDRQSAVPVGPDLLGHLRNAGTTALGLIREKNLTRSEEVVGAAVFLVDDQGIAAVHDEFFGDPDPTDVITFPFGNYGEILVSVETARRQAVGFSGSFERELTLYIVHGLLHLHGYEDGSAPAQAEMELLQERLVAEILRSRSGK